MKEPTTLPEPAPVSLNSEPRRIDVEALLAGASEIRILWRDLEYRLTVTRQGKLILTK